MEQNKTYQEKMHSTDIQEQFRFAVNRMSKQYRIKASVFLRHFKVEFPLKLLQKVNRLQN